MEECLERIGCTQSALDPALFYMTKQGELIGFIACHVDDFLHAGNQEFEDMVLSKLKKRFLAGTYSSGTFSYIGFHIGQDPDCITMDQSAYMAKIKNRKIDPNRAMNKYDALSQTEQTLFRQLVGRINWAVQGSRPDLAFEMIDLSTRLKQSTVGDLVRAIKNVERLKTGPSVIRFFKFRSM